MSDAILKALDSVEKKMSDAAVDRATFADRLLQLEQSGSAHLGERPSSTTGIGAEVVKAFRASEELFNKTRNVRLEIKAAGDPVTTATGRTIVSGGVGAPGANLLGIQNALVTRPASGTSALEYSRYTGQQGAAAVQAVEGDTKSALRPDHSLIVQSAITIAGFTKLSRQSLSDSREMARAVETVLMRSVNTALDTMLVSGSAAPVFAGFSPLATAYTSLLYPSLADATSEGVASMQAAGFNPDVVVFNPASWLTLSVAKATDGSYLSGNYLGAMPSEMRGLRVVISPAMAAGKILLIDSSHSELLIVDGYSIEVGTDGSDFTKNLATLLCEVRVIPVFRTVGSARLITTA